MIIKHNLASIGAFYQSKINSYNKAKTSRRLSSGYRINSAADDAAGLSISQKMRAQIRGLSKANENIQDGISFVQIGEGGMQEVHDILHRINELSVKAANGTNAQVDRAAIQSEIDALSEEINRIAYSTSFNEHYMLCGEGTRGVGGSGGSTGSVIDSAVADALSKRATYGGSGSDSMGSAIYNPDGTVVFCGSTDSNDQDLDGAGSTSGGRGWVTKVGRDGEVLWTTKTNENAGFGSITATADGGYLAAGNSNGNPFLTKLDTNGSIEWTYQFQCSGSPDASNINNAFSMQDGSGNVFLSIQSYAGNGIKDGRGNPLGGSALGGRDTIMLVIDPTVNPNTDYDAFEKKAYRVGGDSNEQIARLCATSDGGYIGGNYSTSSSIIQRDNNGNVTNPPTRVIGNGHHHAYIAKFDKSGNAERILLFGDNNNGIVGNSGENVSQIIETSTGEYIVVGKSEITDTVGTTAPSTDRSRGGNIWVMKLDKNLIPIWSRSYGSSQEDYGNCVVETENGYVIAGRVGTIDGDVTPKPGYSGSSAWVFMVDKDSGDIIWDEVHGGTGSDSFNFMFEIEGGDILLGGNSSSTDEDLTNKNKGSGDAWFLRLDGQTGENVQSSGGTGGASKASSVKNPFVDLQVSSYCGIHFRIDYADMRTTAVFGKNTVLNVMSQDAAEKVISLCSQAIEYVSRQRNLYGSYQNALEHLHAANALTGENVSASDSRLSDADIADETMAFSCSQILEQVNFSVMAQANTANQTVLKLLTK